MSNTVRRRRRFLKTKHQRLNGKAGTVRVLRGGRWILGGRWRGPWASFSGYGVSVTGRFCFKVSMRDKTPRFTLVVTRLVTESAGGGGGRTFWEGGLATKHFWYRSCNETGLVAVSNVPSLLAGCGFSSSLIHLLPGVNGLAPKRECESPVTFSLSGVF